MARSTMAGLITTFRLYRGDITSSVITDSEVERIFDLNREYFDKVQLFPDSDNKIFETPFRHIESGASIIDGSDNVVTPDATFFIEGRFTFTAAQSSGLRIKGYYHNLFKTLAMAYRMVAQESDRWEKYKRGEVELTKSDVNTIANNFERLGFRRKVQRMERS